MLQKIIKKLENITPNVQVTTNTTATNVTKKNLGENGHGIRQNITKPSITPPLIHSVIPTVTNPDISTTDNGSKFDLFNEDELDDQHFNQSLKNHNITITKTVSSRVIYFHLF